MVKWSYRGNDGLGRRLYTTSFPSFRGIRFIRKLNSSSAQFRHTRISRSSMVHTYIAILLQRTIIIVLGCPFPLPRPINSFVCSSRLLCFDNRLWVKACPWIHELTRIYWFFKFIYLFVHQLPRKDIIVPQSHCSAENINLQAEKVCLSVRASKRLYSKNHSTDFNESFAGRRFMIDNILELFQRKWKIHEKKNKTIPQWIHQRQDNSKT